VIVASPGDSAREGATIVPVTHGDQRK